VSPTCPQLAELVHALTQAADLLLAAGLPGLSLTFNDDRISIQIGRDLANEQQRAAMVERLPLSQAPAPTTGAAAAPPSTGSSPTATWRDTTCTSSPHSETAAMTTTNCARRKAGEPEGGHAGHATGTTLVDVTALNATLRALSRQGPQPSGLDRREHPQRLRSLQRAAGAPPSLTSSGRLAAIYRRRLATEAARPCSSRSR
jgi:hypothetical protein